MRGVKEFSVVVVGAMNPALHYPAWYSIGDPTFEQEAAFAIGRGQVMLVPQFAQFETEHFRVQCLPERWSIVTREADMQARAIEITCRTFERLNETPLTSFGVNYEFRGKVKETASVGNTTMSSLISVSEKLAPRVSKLVLREDIPAGQFGAASSVVRFVQYQLEDICEPTAKLRVNLHSTISAEGYFDFSPMVRSITDFEAQIMGKVEGLLDIEGEA